MSIEDGAFEGCSGLKSLKLQGSIKKIGESAFKDCIGLNSLSEIEVEEIGNYAFAGCANLK
ncbi:hypothetical protein M9Y10_012101 [Tritrichomonas musculus]|uniref:Leucine-rich repeat domain-containing protein n=1 Tax=Tritrichomonas musculus TaxID=1915356 RepID=A0ABR2IBT4_9EUKA